MNRNAAGVCVRLVDVLVAGEDQRRVGGGSRGGWIPV